MTCHFYWSAVSFTLPFIQVTYLWFRSHYNSLWILVVMYFTFSSFFVIFCHNHTSHIYVVRTFPDEFLPRLHTCLMTFITEISSSLMFISASICKALLLALVSFHCHILWFLHFQVMSDIFCKFNRLYLRDILSFLHLFSCSFFWRTRATSSSRDSSHIF
jgi:hypothetical protein